MGCRHATDAKDPTSAAACALKSSAQSDADPPKPPPSRADLISSVFHACDTDDDDHLNCLELMRFASLVDYLDNDSPEAWTKKYDWMCEQFAWVPEVGADIGAFTRLVDNDDAAGYFRTTSELRRLLRELLELSKLDASDDSEEESSSSCSSTQHRSRPADSAHAAARHLRAIKRRKRKQKKRMVGALSKAHRNSSFEVVEKLLFHGVDTLLQEDGEISALHCAAEAYGLLEGDDSDLRRLINDFRSSRWPWASQLLHNESDSEGNEEAAAKPGMRRKTRKVGHHEGPLAKKAIAKRKLPSLKPSSATPLGETSPGGVDRETSQEDQLHASTSALSECLPEEVGRPRAQTDLKEEIDTVNVQLLNDLEDDNTFALHVARAASLPAAPDSCFRSKKHLLRRHHQPQSRGSITRNAPMRGHRRESPMKGASPGNEDENVSPVNGDTVNESDERQQADHSFSEQTSPFAVRKCASEDVGPAEDFGCDSDHSNDGQELHKAAKTRSKKGARLRNSGGKSHRARLLPADR
mmetsp:Transcript_146498/g.255537  ORF Transcript_146498/g.255537 Transcript_146498/m.255537 type:complete len:525 (-) Transcript_146498:47-1621(-)